AKRLVLRQVRKDASNVGDPEPSALAAILDYVDGLPVVGVVSPFDVAIDQGTYHSVGIANAFDNRFGQRYAEDQSTEDESLRAGKPPSRVGYAATGQEADQEVSQLCVPLPRPLR